MVFNFFFLEKNVPTQLFKNDFQGETYLRGRQVIPRSPAALQIPLLSPGTIKHLYLV